VATQDDIPGVNGYDPLEPQDSSGRTRKRHRGPTRPSAEGADGAPARSKAADREPVNSIEARRRPRKEKRNGQTEVQIEAPAPPGSQAPSYAPGGDSDPWTVPQSVRDRFVQDGHRFYFPDGIEAFKDRGRRLTTTSENTQVVHSLIDIARSRGWTEVTVSGTERFRQEAWRQARMAGLAVRGYKPNQAEHVQLIRGLARQQATPAGEPDPQASTDQRREDRSPDNSPSPVAPANAAASGAVKERIAGRLVDFGRDAYRHDPREDASYFVRVETRSGHREVWGKDLERAIMHSLTQPQIGDDVVLQQTGRDTVTVNRPERDNTGQLRATPVDTHRNRWVLEKSSFFEERTRTAQLVRDASLDARAAVREHPELAGTYLSLRAAELVARRFRDPEDRQRFVSQVRVALADGIERGEPLQPVRLHPRAVARLRKDRGDRSPESALVRS